MSLGIQELRQTQYEVRQNLENEDGLREENKDELIHTLEQLDHAIGMQMLGRRAVDETMQLTASEVNRALNSRITESIYNEGNQ